MISRKTRRGLVTLSQKSLQLTCKTLRVCGTGFRKGWSRRRRIKVEVLMQHSSGNKKEKTRPLQKGFAKSIWKRKHSRGGLERRHGLLSPSGLRDLDLYLQARLAAHCQCVRGGV